jgi:hypothetical protein
MFAGFESAISIDINVAECPGFQVGDECDKIKRWDIP